VKRVAIAVGMVIVTIAAALVIVTIKGNVGPIYVCGLLRARLRLHPIAEAGPDGSGDRPGIRADTDPSADALDDPGPNPAAPSLLR
jgi:hypothetical protein